jgi:hypothetical protein
MNATQRNAAQLTKKQKRFKASEHLNVVEVPAVPSGAALGGPAGPRVAGRAMRGPAVTSRASFRLTPARRELLAVRARAGVAASSQPAAATSAAETDPAVPPIQPVRRDVALPLSFAQERLWLLQQLQPASPFYNVPAMLRLSGPLVPAVLAAAVREIVRRHEILRTRFRMTEGGPRQEVLPAAGEIAIPCIDLAGLAGSSRAADHPARERLLDRMRASQALAVAQLARAAAARPFDLARGPLLRLLLLRLGAREHVVLVILHHIVCDGWSLGVFVRELSRLYGSAPGGPPAPLPIQYGDYAVWQRRTLTGAALDRLLARWRTRLRDAPPLLELPAARPRPAVQSQRGATRQFRLPRPLSAALSELLHSERATCFMGVLAAFATLLLRYTGREDMIVGTSVANRHRVETEALIGFFVNTLVLRIDLGGDPSFAEALGRTREAVLAALADQEMPFEKLVEELKPPRDPAYVPLVQMLCVLQNAPLPPLALPGLTIDWEPVYTGTSKFDVTFSIRELADGLAGQVEYSTDLFDAATIARLIAHYTTLLEAAVQGPEQRVAVLPLLAAAERHQLLCEWRERPLAVAAGAGPPAGSVAAPGGQPWARVLDRGGNPAPIGIAGELWLGAATGRRARLRADGSLELLAGPEPPARPAAPERGPAARTAAVAPRNELERTIATVWRQVLGRDAIGIHENFFDLGGYSMLMVAAHHLLQLELRREIPLLAPFQYSTISGLAAFLDQGEDGDREQAFAERRAKAASRKAAMGRHRRLRQGGATPGG